MNTTAQKAAASVGTWRPEYATYTRNLVYVGSLSTILATLLNLIAFSTHHWIEGPGRERSPFLSLGFHEACFYMCRTPYCPLTDYTFLYDGCHWIYSEHFMGNYHWLRPDWYMTSRNLSIATVPLSLVCLVLVILCACTEAMIQCSSYTGSREKCTIVLLYIALFPIFGTAVIIVVVMGIFRMSCFELGWMPMPDRNELGYSFWLDLLAAALFFLSFITLFLAAILKILWKPFLHLEPGAGMNMMLGGT